ncbi:Predicted flavin-nucleotide-binding protein, pyridoxine 5'-phosphate oxidase superfamily [Aureimonas phyllosphaerae]|uniref:Putative pyridoxine 5'-phosphate oxidase superfamily flavin-nucleotide-binding protein n=1 Tax=Aureimonas phyllosphaerae TaxID=1166078 RepID=A0A7W6FVX8_9HYPH|nr:putative pyridoxine 5'-phosphate oxidase superfamily flavin-nucleotide-binding protein [Aureimonas phyllosphaerae]MBB3961312.1 putative pyridoxine 5'-phosphate oxidase superfamily flavin-nucleotide-binding protein [Aureimonas phyllosphaerae]SFF41734.1 Predicted flavin-nucleotide-binding protein, pyridoxine 5'-phosphate oxidase superfamily [Aureimonas phyllosphaerae]
MRGFDRFTANEADFIAARDNFYIASASETGWPYVQHRGGPRGFLKVADDTSLSFADYSGNRQYISLGNFNADDRACLFLMDYARRARLKIYGHVEIVAPEADPQLLEQVTVPSYRARIERIVRVRLAAFDWNCPQHIIPRFTEAGIAEAVQPMRERIAALEAENAILRQGTAPSTIRVRTHSSEPEENGGSQCDGGEEDGWTAVVAGRDTAPVLEAAEHDLNAVAASVAALVVFDGRVARPSPRDAGLDALCLQGVPEPVGIVAAVTEQPLRLADRQARLPRRYSH